MPKHADAVKSFEDFRAPWETEGGTDAEIDKPKLRRYIYNLIVDKAKAQDSRDDTATKLEETEKALETAKAEVADASGEEAAKKVEKLEKKVSDLTSERDKLVAAKEEADLRAEVLEGLDSKYAKYVKGTTREELEKSLEEVKTDFGLETKEGDEEDEDGEPKLRTRPRTNLNNPADGQSGKGGEEEVDFDKVADEILGGGVFR